MTSLKTNILFLGNPGKGKSTLLNGLIGRTVFKSGFSQFGGLTYKLHKQEVNGVMYMDTPGLDDADQEMKKKAADAVTESLKANGIYKVFFIITLESGRFDPRDSTLISVILDHAPDITKYGLIINKVSPAMRSKLDVDKFIRSWAGQGFTRLPADCLLIDDKAQLKDLEDILPGEDLRDELEQFVAGFEGMKVEAARVSTISPNDFEDKLKELTAVIQELKKNNEAMERRIVQLQNELAARPPPPPRRKKKCCVM